MQPGDIPALGGAGGGGGGGGGVTPAAVSSLRSAALEAEYATAGAIDALARDVRDESAALELRATDGIGTVYVESQHGAVRAAKRVQGAVDTIHRAVRDVAADAESRAHLAYSQVGGVPYLLTEEAYGTNQADAHYSEAVHRLIAPAIDQQESGVADLPAAPEDGGGSADAPPLPPAPDLPPVADPLPPPPPAPPDPTAPPDAGTCCPPTSIVVPAPVVYITLPGGTTIPATSLPTGPPPPATLPGGTTVPSDGLPTGAPVAPPPVPPTMPTVPPVTSPTPTLPGWSAPAGYGPHDGPDLCVALVRDVQLAEGGTTVAWRQRIRDAVRSVAVDAEQVPVIGGALAAMVRATMGLLWGVQDSTSAILAPAGIPNPVAAMTHMALTSVTGFANRWLGIDWSYWLQPSQQSAYYANPLNVLSQGDADATYLTGGLSYEQWNCITRMNGNSPWQHDAAMFSRRTRLGPSEIVSLYKRGQITEPALYDMMRSVGVLETDVVRQMLTLTEYVPSTPELFTWLTKDVYNEKFALSFGLDEDFPDPMPPQWTKWFAANGTTAEQIKYQYRAQWVLPSKTQTDEFIRRLRPGRVAKALEFSKEDANQLYKLNEIPAGIRSRMLATSYQPVALTYLIEAFKAGTMDEAELVERLQDIGYSAADATFMKTMIVAKSVGQMQGSMGAWTRRRIVREYVQGHIDRERAGILLGRTVLDLDAMEAALDDADAIRSATSRGQCVKGVRRRYFTGELDRDQARTALLQLGVDMITQGTLLTGWTCERSSRSKEPTVKQLTEWATLGILSDEEYRRRLLNLGYTDVDADRIMRAADAAYDETVRRREEADRRRAAADARRAAADERRRRKAGG